MSFLKKTFQKCGWWKTSGSSAVVWDVFKKSMKERARVRTLPWKRLPCAKRDATTVPAEGDFEKFTRVQNSAWGVHAPQTVRNTSVGHIHFGLDAKKVSRRAVELSCAWIPGFLWRFCLNSFCRDPLILRLTLSEHDVYSIYVCVYKYTHIKCGRGAHMWASCNGSH